jgi:hypothetical protein
MWHCCLPLLIFSFSCPCRQSVLVFRIIVPCSRDFSRCLLLFIVNIYTHMFQSNRPSSGVKDRCYKATAAAADTF